VTGVQTCALPILFNTENKKNDFLGFAVNTRPFLTYDFYEPRSENEKRFVQIPEQIQFYFFLSQNYNRKFAIDFNPYFTFLNERERVVYNLFFSPRYRINDKITIIYGLTYNRQNNNTGWVAFDEDDNTIFARRNRISVINTIQGKYTLNNKMNFNLLVRHYWSYVTNKRYLTLLEDGTFADNFAFTENLNQNFNTWNLDLSYSWWFAPGSQVSVMYRNSSSLFSREFERTFNSNFKDAIDNNNLNHTFSISLRYFIDYNSLKK
jgi:hypothetical protein